MHIVSSTNKAFVKSVGYTLLVTQCLIWACQNLLVCQMIDRHND